MHTEFSQAKIHQILILGGGFAGIRCALQLSRRAPKNVHIRLLSDKNHFEYPGALYRVVAGFSPLETYVPFDAIFEGTRVEALQDAVVSINPEAKTVQAASGSHYIYDTLVIALGSESAFFNIPGIEKLAFTMKSVNDAIRLNKHIQRVFRETMKESVNAEKLDDLHIVIVGGGPSGTELAAELAVYTKKLCKECVSDESLVTIDLIEAAPRILGAMPPSFSRNFERRLRELGVNIFLNRAVMQKELETVYLKDMEMTTKTLVWTAGVKPHRILGGIKGFAYDKKGRVLVDEYLQAQGFSGVYVLGDGASTDYAGLAQTALNDGDYVAKIIISKLKNFPSPKYKPKKVVYAIPGGPKWAGVVWGPFTFYGRIGWFIRRTADFKVYWSILPLFKAMTAFKDGAQLCDDYPECFELSYKK